MATSRGTPRIGVRPRARTPVVEEILPNSAWTEDSAGHYLLVDLPEFRKDDVKLQVDSNGHIIVKGERKASEQIHVRFQLSFPVPVNSDVDKISGKFESEILYVTVPKRIAQENKEGETENAGNGVVGRAEEHYSHENNADNDGRDVSQNVSHTEQEEKRDENAHIGDIPEQLRKWEQESMLRSTVNVLRKNKGIVITAVIAFSMGLFVSRKFKFSEEP